MKKKGTPIIMPIGDKGLILTTKEQLKSRIQATAQDTCGCELIQFKDKDLSFKPCSQHNTVGDDYQIAKLKRQLRGRI